jgi:copper chaperone CopZ
MGKIVVKKLKINGMHCTSCALNIDFDLEDLSGVKSARTNYAKQLSVIEFDEEELNINAILETVTKTGYEASVVKD